MKTNIALISLALLAVACAKDPSGNALPSGDVRFAASFDEVFVKTELSGTKVLWQKDDAISILWEGGNTTAVAASAGESTSFSAEVGTADTYYAVYPSSVTSSLSGDVLSVTVPAAQHGTFAEANIAIARTSSDKKTFAFKNLCALGKITLERSDIAEIRFAGAGNEALAGTVAVTLDGNGIPSCGEGAADTEIVLTPASGEAFAAGTYYFSLLPQDLEDGLSVTLTTSTGATILKKASASKAEMDRSAVMEFGKPDGSATEVTVTFDFSIVPQLEGWPVAKGTHVDGGTPAVYPVDGTDYTFILADCDGAKSLDVFWAGTSSSRTHSVLFMASGLRYFGFPVLEGYKLTKVDCTCFRYSAGTEPVMGIVTDIVGDSKVNPYDGNHDEYIVHDLVGLGINGNVTTFNLSGTEAGTRYYMYCKAKGGFTSLTLTYTR